MASNIRKLYMDNLRWMILLVLIPYHASQAWNTWGEPNYIFIEGNPLISSIIVFFSPYFMPLLFVLSGMSTVYALQKRTYKEYFCERVKRLLVPFLLGTIVLMPVMSYIGDKFNYSYNEGFLKHYIIFFTKWTDLTGADGGFSVGQFWFLLYLLVISFMSVGIIVLLEKVVPKAGKSMPFWLILLLGLPLPVFSDWLSIGGKSLAEYTYFFLLGYYVFANEETVCKLEKHRLVLFGIGLVSTILNVYLFLWTDGDYAFVNDIMKYLSKWFMVIALIGLAKRNLNFTGSVSEYMSKRSFLFYFYHFIWVVLFQYILYGIVGNQTAILFVGTVLLSYLATFACCEIHRILRILFAALVCKFCNRKESV